MRRHRLLKSALFVACLVPLALLVADLVGGRLGAEPIREATFRTGEWGLRFLTATLAVTPLRRLFGWNGLVKYRRMLGLFTFSYISIHFLIWFAVDQFFALKYILEDIAKRPYITVGFTGFLLMLPLAVTSTAGWVRRLGKRWTRLHALIYLIALAGIVHFTWAQKADILRPSIYAGIIVVLLAVRLLPRRVRRRDSTGAAGASQRDDQLERQPGELLPASRRLS
ncbi:MAG: sulfite oxidase heme-binding subunit YedZ [Gemmatimonadales bacterium]